MGASTGQGIPARSGESRPEQPVRELGLSNRHLAAQRPGFLAAEAVETAVDLLSTLLTKNEATLCTLETSPPAACSVSRTAR